MLRPRRRSRAGLNADINVTSLVDVAFVLLIIFMIAAPMMQGGVEVRLPRAEARPLEAREGLMISVDRRGRVWVEGTSFSYADFRASFRGMIARRRPTGVYLQADRGAPYGDVVRVLAVVRAAGIQNVGLVAEPEDLPR